MKKIFLNGRTTVRHADPRFTAKRYSSAEDLENEANNLSNFGGGAGGYVGLGDDFLDFAGNANTLASMAAEAKPYVIQITNANAAPRTLLLCPGLIAQAPGLMVTGAFNDIAGGAGLSAQSLSPGSIEEFNAFVQKYPSVVAGMKIGTANLGQIEQSFTLVKKSPFQEHSSKVITPGIFGSEQNFNTAILTVPVPFYLDSQTYMKYTVIGNSSVVITLMIGVSLNIAKALRSKTEKAKTTIASLGGPATVSKFIG